MKKLIIVLLAILLVVVASNSVTKLVESGALKDVRSPYWSVSQSEAEYLESLLPENN